MRGGPAGKPCRPPEPRVAADRHGTKTFNGTGGSPADPLNPGLLPTATVQKRSTVQAAKPRRPPKKHFDCRRFRHQFGELDVTAVVTCGTNLGWKTQPAAGAGRQSAAAASGSTPPNRTRS